MTDKKNFDERALRKCFGQFATGVTVITARVGQTRVGVTANSYSSLSIEPPLILWSIKRTSRSFDAFQAAEHFAINILSTEQIGISQAFSGPETDKFSGVECSAGKTGSPVFPGAIAVIECAAETRYDGGDHVILIGRVLHFTQSPGEALLFSQGRYAVAVDHPKLTQSIDPARQIRDAPDEAELPFWTLMFQAQQRMAQRFESHRQEEGLIIEQVRVLIDIFDAPGCSFEDLVTRSFLPRAVAQDALDGLIDSGLVHRDRDGGLRLTEEGSARRRAIAVRWKAFEEAGLAGIPREDIERARHVLTAILSH